MPAGAASSPRSLAAFEKGEIDVLVGTQMIAKGHDFPRVTLVGVVDADVGLGIPDFRSAERTFQLLTQVAGRAGRGETAGEVILQSHMPDHYALGHACAQDYDSFFEREMEFRRTMGYPPVAALVNVIVRAAEAPKGAAEADALARVLRASAGGRYRVLGPAHAPLARLRNEHRFQIVLKGQRPAMRDAVKAALVARYGPQRWPGVAVDVDPLTRHVRIHRRPGGSGGTKSPQNRNARRSRRRSWLALRSLGALLYGPGRCSRRAGVRSTSACYRNQAVEPHRLEEVVPVEHDRVRHEAHREDRQAEEPHPHPRAADRRLVVEGRGVAPAENADEDGPEDPVRAEVDERHADPRGDPRDEARALAQQRSTSRGRRPAGRSA